MSRGIPLEQAKALFSGKKPVTVEQLQIKVESLESALTKLSNVEGVPEEVKAEIAELINPQEGESI